MAPCLASFHRERLCLVIDRFGGDRDWTEDISNLLGPLDICEHVSSVWWWPKTKLWDEQLQTIMITVGEDYIVWELDERQKTAAHNPSHLKSHCLFPSWGVSGHEQHRMHGQHNCKMQQLPTISRLILLMNQSAQFCCSYNFNKGAGRRGYRERVHHCTTNCFLPKMQIIVFAKDWNLFVLIASWRRANMPYLFFSKLSLCFISPPPTHCFCLGLLAIHQVSKRKLFRID